MHLSIRNIASNKDERLCVPRHIFNTNIIHNFVQLKLRDFLKNTMNLPIEIKMCTMCTSNVRCGSGDMLSGATGGEFGIHSNFS